MGLLALASKSWGSLFLVVRSQEEYEEEDGDNDKDDQDHSHDCRQDDEKEVVLCLLVDPGALYWL